MLDPADVTETVYRASGKGGQHRNVTDSAVRLQHRPSGLTVTAERERSQHENRRAAWAELERRLRAQADETAAAALNAERRSQIETAERPSRDWTWCAWRDEVREHETGRRLRMSAAMRGRW